MVRKLILPFLIFFTASAYSQVMRYPGLTVLFDSTKQRIEIIARQSGTWTINIDSLKTRSEIIARQGGVWGYSDNNNDSLNNRLSRLEANTNALRTGLNVTSKADSIFPYGTVDSSFQDTLGRRAGLTGYKINTGTMWTSKSDSCRLWTNITDTSSTTTKYVEILSYMASIGDSVSGYDIYAYCNTNSSRIPIAKASKVAGTSVISMDFIPPIRLPAKYFIYGRKYINWSTNGNNKNADIEVTIRYRYR